MSISIDKQLTIGKLRENFQKEFPYLRLDFFRPESTFIPLFHERLRDDIVLKNIQRTEFEIEDDFVIDGKTRVKDLENFFRNAFHADAQVLRRSGTQWLITTATDKYTLEMENAIGEEMLVASSQTEPEDIHEQP